MRRAACALALVFTAPLPSVGGSRPTIEFDPTPQAAILGGEAILTVIAGGDGPLSYQWLLGGRDLADGPGIAGTAADSLILSDVDFDDAGDYSVVVSNPFGSVTSAEVALAVDLPRGGDVESAFDQGSSFNSTPYAMVLQPDGKLLIAGGFTTVDGAARGRIARLHPDRTPDHTFGNGQTGADDRVWSLARTSDGKVLIAGEFTSVNGTSRGHIARLNADGSLDTTFLDGLAGANDTIQALALQPDGRVVIVGEFTTVNGVSRGHVARLNADGSLDGSFLDGLAGTNHPARSVAVQSDGRVLIGGDFGVVNGVFWGRMARLNTDGSLDTTFGPVTISGGTIWSIVVQPDGRVLIGGEFSLVNGVFRGRIARLNGDGSLDTTFLNGLNGANDTVRHIDLEPGGRVLIGGAFTFVNGVVRQRIARMNSNGSLDTTFLQSLGGANNSVNAVALLPDGRMLIAGFFTAYFNGANGVNRRHLARLNGDGSVDMTFPDGGAGFDEGVREMAVQPDGRVLLGGFFTKIDGVSRRHIARLNADGSLDTTFLDGLTGTNSSVSTVTLAPDGRVLIGGTFSEVNGVDRQGIARLHADGSLDMSFDGATGGWISSIVIQPDGRVVVGGTFFSSSGQPLNAARLLPNGSLDSSFHVRVDATVQSVALQPDGRVLIGGDFQRVGAVDRAGIARLNANGSLDASFVDGLAALEQAVVLSIVLQPDGRVLVGGSFDTFSSNVHGHVVRLNADGSLDATFSVEMPTVSFTTHAAAVALQPDGRVLVGGVFPAVNGVGRSNLARLEANGSLDATFLDGGGGTDGFGVGALVALPDGRVLVGGRFGVVNGVPTSAVARLYGDVPDPAVIVTPPTSQVTYDGCCAVLGVKSTGSPRDYSWSRDGIAIVDGAEVSGAATETLTLLDVSSKDAGAYDVTVSNVLGSQTSDDAVLEVQPLPECRDARCETGVGCVLHVAADGTSCAPSIGGLGACVAGSCR